MSRKAGITMSLIWGICFGLIAVGGGLGVAFLEDMGLFKAEPKPLALNDSFKFSGPVKLEQLNLTQKEIQMLNRAARQHSGRVEKTEIKVSSESWTGGNDPDCELEYTFQSRAEDGHVVEANMRRTTRKQLVRELERQLDVAEGVLRKCHDEFPNFKIVYM